LSFKDPLLLALVVCVLAAGTGCSNTRVTREESATTTTFEGNGVTFEHPPDWETLSGVEDAASTGDMRWQHEIGIDSTNYISVRGYDLGGKVTEENIDDLESDITSQIAALVEETGGSLEGNAERSTIDGLPALTYRATGITTVADETVDSTLVLIFDGKTEYFIDCQATEDRAEEIAAGCDQVIETIDLP